MDNKKSLLRIQNKDSLCLARAIGTDIARQDKDLNGIQFGKGVKNSGYSRSNCIRRQASPKVSVDFRKLTNSKK